MKDKFPARSWTHCRITDWLQKPFLQFNGYTNQLDLGKMPKGTPPTTKHLASCYSVARASYHSTGWMHTFIIGGLDKRETHILGWERGRDFPVRSLTK